MSAGGDNSQGTGDLRGAAGTPSQTRGGRAKEEAGAASSTREKLPPTAWKHQEHNGVKP